MTASTDILDFRAKLEAYIGEQIPEELDKSIRDVADKFWKLGRSDASKKCSPAPDTIFQSIGALTFPDDQEIAKAMGEYVRKRYMTGYNGEKVCV